MKLSLLREGYASTAECCHLLPLAFLPGRIQKELTLSSIQKCQGRRVFGRRKRFHHRWVGMEMQLTQDHSQSYFSCLCCLIENTELKKLDVSMGYCKKLKILLSMNSMAVQPSSVLVWCLYKQIVLSLFFLNTIMPFLSSSFSESAARFCPSASCCPCIHRC